MSVTHIVFPSVSVVIGTMGLIVSILNSKHHDSLRDRAKNLNVLIGDANKLLNVKETPDAALLCAQFVKKVKDDLTKLTIEATQLACLANDLKFWELARSLRNQLSRAENEAAGAKIGILTTTNEAVQAAALTTPAAGSLHPSPQTGATGPQPTQLNRGGSSYPVSSAHVSVPQTTNLLQPQGLSGQNATQNVLQTTNPPAGSRPSTQNAVTIVPHADPAFQERRRAPEIRGPSAAQFHGPSIATNQAARSNAADIPNQTLVVKSTHPEVSGQNLQVRANPPPNKHNMQPAKTQNPYYQHMNHEADTRAGPPKQAPLPTGRSDAPIRDPGLPPVPPKAYTTRPVALPPVSTAQQAPHQGYATAPASTTHAYPPTLRDQYGRAEAKYYKNV